MKNHPGHVRLSSELAVVVSLFFVALAVRLGTYLRTDVIFNDGPVFLEIAEQMRLGRFDVALAHDQHPGYSLLIRAAGWIFDTPFDAAIAVSLIFGCLSVVALYVFLFQAWDRRVATLGAFMLAMNPYAARFSSDVQTESVYLFFFLASVAALFGALRLGAPRGAGLAGVFSGLAYLTRPEGMGIALAGVALAGVSWLRGSWSGRRMAGFIGALMLGLGAVAAPYLIVVRAVSGHFRLSQKKSLLAIMGLEPIDAGSAHEIVTGGTFGVEGVWVLLLVVAVIVTPFVLNRVRGSAAARIRVGPFALAGVFALAALAAEILAPDSFGVFLATLVSTLRPEILLLMGIGIVTSARHGPRGRTLFVALLVGLYAGVLFGLLISYGYMSRRHALPPLTLLLGYAATGAVIVIDWFSARLRVFGARATRADAYALLAVMGLIAAIALPKAWHAHRAEEMAARMAAEWLADRPEADGVLASNRQKHGWYAGLPWLPLTQGGQTKSLDLLEREGVRWVLAEGEVLDSGNRSLSPLRDNKGSALVERYDVEYNGRSVSVFELVRRSP